MAEYTTQQFTIEPGYKVELDAHGPAEVILKTKGGTEIRFNVSINNPAEIDPGDDIESCHINVLDSGDELKTVK